MSHLIRCSFHTDQEDSFKGGSPGQVIIAQADCIGTGVIWLGADASDGNLMTGLVPLPLGCYHQQPLKSQSLITDGHWHHVGFIWDGAYRSLYMDGTEVARDTAIQNPLQYANDGLYIGSGNNLDVGSFFSGLIDYVRIYPLALIAKEIEELSR